MELPVDARFSFFFFGSGPTEDGPNLAKKFDDCLHVRKGKSTGGKASLRRNLTGNMEERSPPSVFMATHNLNTQSTGRVFQ
jgi:hypothetical protein